MYTTGVLACILVIAGTIKASYYETNLYVPIAGIATHAHLSTTPALSTWPK